ncbi:hypothetical protein EON83_27215 [bacterium]|nr:MAG: hypothetical protein EON83_27215 [bacterium]
MNDEQLPPDSQNEAERLRQQVMRLCREIPEGQVASYGQIGALCDPPISGYICGRVMGNVMDNVPWWRIIGKDGKLPISKRGPNHSLDQRKRLENEGVGFDEDGKVEKHFFMGARDMEPKDEQGSLF